MTPERWQRIKEIFEEATAVPADSRSGFLAVACRDEDERRQVERLLENQRDTDTFLEAPLPLRQSLARDEVIGGRYQVVRLLGRGGMGEVYDVQDQLLNERIALKTLRVGLTNDALLRRFQKEIQLARKVTHPNVCRVFEVGIHEFPDKSRLPLHFFTMQLLAGETLAARIRREGRMRSAEAFPLIVQMAEGLGAAHNAGIIHCDFKSANVMVDSSRAVITDFGLAGLERGAVPGPPEAEMGPAGTVAYMSPEQMSGEPITPASDIYSLGIVLFEMATGRLPYEDQHIIQSAMQRVRRQSLPIRTLAPDIDPRWESAIRRCLELEPERRFRSASDVAAVFAPGKWRPPPVYWTRRRWAITATVSALPIAGGAALWIQYHRPYRPNPEAMEWYRKGVEALHAMTFEAARRDLEKSIAVDPRYAPAYAYLAWAYTEIDAPEKASDSMLAAMAAAQEVRLTGRDTLRVRACRHLVRREFTLAQPVFEELVSTAGRNEKAAAYLDLAMLAQRQYRNATMEPLLEQALKLDPENAGAKLRLAIALDRQRKRDAARKLFEEAESLFNTASNYGGVLETLLQEAVALGRSGKSVEAITVIQRGMGLAASTGDLNHQVRLQLALALADRNAGETAKSKAAAEAAVKIALEQRMDSVTATGLLDLGYAYLQRDEPEPAERYFRLGLEFAQRGRALFSQARAQSSLASLFVQYDRPAEMTPYLEPALKFFRDSGYPRELAQNSLILAAAQETLGEFDEDEKTLRGIIGSAAQIDDPESIGMAHHWLGVVLDKSGRWPEALPELDLALDLLADFRRGSRAAFVLLDRARIKARMGEFTAALADLSELQAKVQRLEGPQSQLRARLVLVRAEIASYQLRWDQVRTLAAQAATFNGGTSENLEVGILTGVALLQLGRVQAGLDGASRAIQNCIEKSQPYLAAVGQLAVAEAMVRHGTASQGVRFASSALKFFDARRIWESVWRCHTVLAAVAPNSGDHSDLARTALDSVRHTWPPKMVQVYLQRPDTRILTLG
jgi:tetratricopeptide (TPR) repeat protein